MYKIEIKINLCGSEKNVESFVVGRKGTVLDLVTFFLANIAFKQ